MPYAQARRCEASFAGTSCSLAKKSMTPPPFRAQPLAKQLNRLVLIFKTNERSLPHFGHLARHSPSSVGFDKGIFKSPTTFTTVKAVRIKLKSTYLFSKSIFGRSS